MVKKRTPKFPSQLRYDLISKDWVIIATGRAKRPEMFKRKDSRVEELPQDKCPFCKIETQEKPTLILSKGKEVSVSKISKDWTPLELKKFLTGWTTVVVPNKYPALIPHPKLDRKKEGKFYQKMNAVGFCELVVTKDHRKSLGQFKIEEVKEVVDAHHHRYLALMKKSFVNYISIFHNHKAEAGATISHPHSQIITTPLIDSDLRKALRNSKDYYKKEKKCIYCEMNKWEIKVKKRIIFENKKFLVLCPFASKSAFEVIISPKDHLWDFSRISEEDKWQFAEAFGMALSKLYKGLGDPAYNFYLHTVPCDGQDYSHYHWHWTILPKTSTWAGFELGSEMEISTIEPEKAAEYLRKI